MKKAIFTFGLFSLVMVLTSFTTPDLNYSGEPDGSTTSKGNTGGQGTLPGDGGKKLDFETGGVATGDKGKKVDFETGGVQTGDKGVKKLD
ncbi:hypothetical protein [Flavobacterium sp.]|uniref:hypothetical protein n=1 Tax=Flavobacterium sp. TaxID=239 RepID=UPI0012240975|nr:hypothetical protein [Flavobacterium sp.]RZJ72492.1 MAG: hypothetical protein EOO49_06145 [Flavobacterium sp.]